METEQQKQDRLYPLVTCSICHSKTRAEYMEPIRGNMIQRKLCFHCNFWVEHYTTRMVYNGVTPEGGKIMICERTDIGHPGLYHYIAYPFAPNGYSGMVGLGGATVHFKMTDGTVYKSNNVWSQGNIPSHLYHLFPVNAHWMSYDEVKILNRIGNQTMLPETTPEEPVS